MNPPYAFDGSRGGGRYGVYGNGLQEIAYRGWLRYGTQSARQSIGKA